MHIDIVTIAMSKLLHVLQVANDVKKINDKEYTDPEVDLCISIRSLTTIDRTTRVRMRLCSYMCSC